MVAGVLVFFCDHRTSFIVGLSGHVCAFVIVGLYNVEMMVTTAFVTRHRAGGILY